MKNKEIIKEFKDFLPDCLSKFKGKELEGELAFMLKVFFDN